MFEALAEAEALEPAEMPGDPRSIAVTAPVLIHLGLLNTDGKKLSLSRTGHALLQSRDLAMDGAMQALGDLSRLDAVLQEGGPVVGADGTPRVTEIGIREGNPEEARRFLERLHRRSAISAKEVASWVARHLRPNSRILDLGGGHGRYGKALAERGFDVTLFDRPLCVELARERYGGGLAFLAGDFLSDDLGGPYGGVLLSNIIHGLGREENFRLFRRIGDALVPGGVMILKDMFLDELGAHPEKAVFFGLNMLLYTREGKSYSVYEIRSLCKEAGMDLTQHVFVPDGGYSLLFSRVAGRE